MWCLGKCVGLGFTLHLEKKKSEKQLNSMIKFNVFHEDESRWQSTDSSKAYRNSSAFKYIFQ